MNTVLTFLFVLVPSVAFATSNHHEPSVSDLIYPAINFTIFVLFFYFLLRDRVRVGLITRRSNIELAVNRARKLNLDADQILKDAQSRLAILEKEIDSTRQEIETDAANEAQRILTEAKSKAERIRLEVRKSAEAEVKSTEAKIREEVAELAIARAAERLVGRLDESTDRKLRQNILGSIRQLTSK